MEEIGAQFRASPPAGQRANEVTTCRSMDRVKTVYLQVEFRGLKSSHSGRGESDDLQVDESGENMTYRSSLLREIVAFCARDTVFLYL